MMKTAFVILALLAGVAGAKAGESDLLELDQATRLGDAVARFAVWQLQIITTERETAVEIHTRALRANNQCARDLQGECLISVFYFEGAEAARLIAELTAPSGQSLQQRALERLVRDGRLPPGRMINSP